MEDSLLSGSLNGGAYLDDLRLPKLSSASVEEAVVGVNARWVVPNRYVHYEGMVKLLQTVRGTRSLGSAAIEISYVVTGRLDAYMSMRLSPWDIAGGLVIAKEVGAIATNLAFEHLDLLDADSFIVSKPGLHEELLKDYIQLK